MHNFQGPAASGARPALLGRGRSRADGRSGVRAGGSGALLSTPRRGSTPSQEGCRADGHPLPIDEDVVEGIDQRIRSRRTCVVCDRTSQVNPFLSKERRRRVGHGIGLVDRGLTGQLEDELMVWLVPTEDARESCTALPNGAGGIRCPSASGTWF